MKLSTKTRYGTRALVDLAIHQKGHTPVSLKDISERQMISLSYLEHIITPLLSAGMVNSTRGPKGGVALTKPARDIRLKEIVALLEGPTTLVECLVGSKTCPRSSLCATQDLWNEIGHAIDGVLESTTLQDLADKQKNKVRSAEMYYI
jgi:Rrf2 family transcriptional regulator, cysteine metabolism repressor